MATEPDPDCESFDIAKRWCAKRGPGWLVLDKAGRGGTAPVYSIESPNGLRALKIYDLAFSNGEMGEIEAKRVDQQIEIGEHECPWLVKVYEGGTFEDRLVLLMSLAPGRELEKCLSSIPRNKIRSILHQISEAVVFLREKGLCHRDIKSANIYISDDFDHATLLDLSVVRDINDPIGIGTDHNGQLPVVATARYSSPEYLFRLVDPSPEAWKALDVYQLGALLHDLIMRTPLFEEEYKKSKENRYRFAWIVATVDPILEADDVDRDLIFLARRALDKDWIRRLTLELRDFSSDTEARQSHSLQMLGFDKVRPSAVSSNSISLANKRSRLNEVAISLEQEISQRLRGRSVTAQHTRRPLGDLSVKISFVWQASSAHSNGQTFSNSFDLDLSLSEDQSRLKFLMTASLTTCFSASPTEAGLDIPSVSDHDAIVTSLAESAEAALGVLAVKLSDAG